jgi:hypothetical protein
MHTLPCYHEIKVNSMRMFFMSVFALFACCSATRPQKSQAMISEHKFVTTFAVDVFKAPAQLSVAKYDVLMEGTKLPSPDGFVCEIQGSHTSKTDTFGGVMCFVASNASVALMGTSLEVSCKQDAPDTHVSSFTLFSLAHKHQVVSYIYSITCVTK